MANKNGKEGGQKQASNSRSKNKKMKDFFYAQKSKV